MSDSKSTYVPALVVVLIILLIAYIAGVGARPDGTIHQTPAHRCINNLRQIDAAANQFALERNLKTGDPIKFPDDLTSYIKLNSAGKIPPCPDGGIYHISKVGEVPTCSLGSTITPNHILP